MSISVIHFEHQGRAQWGVVRGGRITPIAGDYPTTADLVRAHDADSLATLRGDTLDERAVRLLSPATSSSSASAPTTAST
jgi:2,4-didehydro-3-deoxy-L-rhamnonate hydrolase